MNACLPVALCPVKDVIPKEENALAGGEGINISKRILFIFRLRELLCGCRFCTGKKIVYYGRLY